MATGHSEAFDTVDAARELLAGCRAGLGDARPDGGLLFLSHDHDAAALVQAIRREHPGLPLAGATTLAPITSGASYTEGATALTMFAAPGLRFAAGVGTEASADTGAAVRRAVAHAREELDGEPTLCVVLTRIEGVRNMAMIRALRESLGPACAVFGGGALGEVGDDAEWHGSLQVCGDQVFDDAVVVLLSSGPISVSVGVAHGWRPVGRPGTITRAEGSTVHAIDGQPVQDFYRRYLKGEVGFPLGTPLALVDRETGGTVLRGASSYESEGPVEFLDVMPEGASVSITLATTDDILAGATAAVREAMDGWPGRAPPQAALAVSCAARNLLLGGRVAEERDAIVRALPPGLPLSGAYVGGEIGANGGAALPGLYGHTCIAILLGA